LKWQHFYYLQFSLITVFPAIIIIEKFYRWRRVVGSRISESRIKLFLVHPVSRVYLEYTLHPGYIQDTPCIPDISRIHPVSQIYLGYILYPGYI